MKLPEQTEYNPYFQHYINLVAEGDFESLFHQNTLKTAQYFKEVPFEKHNYRYAPNKWSVKEVLMHIIDTERVFAYRALVCARGDNSTPLPSMDEDLYAANVDVTQRTMESLIDEFLTVRKNSEFLFKNISDQQSKFLGNGVKHNISARALGFIMIGHIHHHVNVLNERYL